MTTGAGSFLQTQCMKKRSSGVCYVLVYTAATRPQPTPKYHL